MDPLLLAGFFSHLVTVSPWYAEEVLSEKDREMSDGLGRSLRMNGIALDGITNGVDAATWDPRHPETAGLPFGFDPRTGDLEGKTRCRRALQDRFGMVERAGAPPGPCSRSLVG